MQKIFRFAHYLLAVEGIALMRSWLVENVGATTRRIEEITRICNALDQLPQVREIVISEVAPREGYAVSSARFDQDRGTDSLVQLEKFTMLRLLAATPPGKALDAACGTGRQTQLLTQLGHDITGVDLTPEMLQYARKQNPQARFILGDLSTLPVSRLLLRPFSVFTRVNSHYRYFCTKKRDNSSCSSRRKQI